MCLTSARRSVDGIAAQLWKAPRAAAAASRWTNPDGVRSDNGKPGLGHRLRDDDRGHAVDRADVHLHHDVERAGRYRDDAAPEAVAGADLQGFRLDASAASVPMGYSGIKRLPPSRRRPTTSLRKSSAIAISAGRRAPRRCSAARAPTTIMFSRRSSWATRRCGCSKS